MKIVKAAIDRPVTTAMFFVAVILIGFVSLRQLSVDLLPDIRYPRLMVMTKLAGVAPEEMETLVTMPLEAAVSRVPGLRRVESASKEGVSILTLEFEWGVNMDFTILHTREKLDGARELIPEDAETPTIITLDPQSKPIIVLAMSMPDRSLLELKELAEELVKPRLEQIEGIGSADVTGGVEREIHVEVDPKLLALYGLTIDEVGARINAFNQDLRGGTIRKGIFKYSMRVVGRYESVAEIGETTLKTAKNGGVVRLKDIAAVIDGTAEREGLTRLDGRESVGLLVHKQAGANTVKVTAAARKALDEIRRENPGLAIEVVSEQASYIKEAIGAVRDELVEGAILAFIVLFLFLQEWRTPLTIGAVIPISVIGTFSLLFYNHITLNVMSLGGLALGVGMLDDCAVVISENIFRHKDALGKSFRQAAYDGATEVGPAAIVTCLNTIIVFFPVVYVRGVAGELFKDSALAVTFCLLASMIVALTLVPMLSARTFRFETSFAPEKSGEAAGEGPDGRRGPKNRVLRAVLWPILTLRKLLYKAVGLLGAGAGATLLARGDFFVALCRLAAAPFRPIVKFVFAEFNKGYAKFLKFHARVLLWSLDHKRPVMFWSVVFMVTAIFLGFGMRRELMPEMKARAFDVQLRTPVDYSLEQTADIAAALEKRLAAVPTVEKTLSQTGIVSGQESLNPDVSLNYSQLYVRARDYRAAAAVLDSLRGWLAAFPDVSYTVTKETTAVAGTLGLASSELSLRIKGEDLDRLDDISAKLMERLRGVPGLADIASNTGEGKPEFQVYFLKEAQQKYAGLSPSDIGDFLVNAVRGKVAAQFHELEKKSDILVRLKGAGTQNIESLLDQTYPHGGLLIPLRDLVGYKVARGPKEIRRENQRREVLVTARLHGAKLSQVIPAVNAIIGKTDLPPDYGIYFGGEREEMSRSFRGLAFAFILGAFLTYMTIAAQFESLLHPFLIMFTLPMGAAGCVTAMLVSGQTVNIMSVIGMIVLVGLVVDNATIKVDYINQLRKRGLGLRPAVIEGSNVRLRPILMSTITTLVGLIPMALGLETGGELLKPLGVVVLGGLTFSTIMTLFLIPVLYEGVEIWRGGRKKARP